VVIAVLLVVVGATGQTTMNNTGPKHVELYINVKE
jgi:hypothetical protein